MISGTRARLIHAGRCLQRGPARLQFAPHVCADEPDLGLGPENSPCGSGAIFALSTIQRQRQADVQDHVDVGPVGREAAGHRGARERADWNITSLSTVVDAEGTALAALH
jgi:hypothetical protein